MAARGTRERHDDLVQMAEPLDLAARLHLLAEQTLEHAILLADPEGRVIWWSPGADKAFGGIAAWHAALGRV